MVKLRHFESMDAQELQRMKWTNYSVENIINMISEWNKLNFNGKYFEMFAIIRLHQALDYETDGYVYKNKKR